MPDPEGAAPLHLDDLLSAARRRVHALHARPGSDLTTTTDAWVEMTSAEVACFDPRAAADMIAADPGLLTIAPRMTLLPAEYTPFALLVAAVRERLCLAIEAEIEALIGAPRIAGEAAHPGILETSMLEITSFSSLLVDPAGLGQS